MKKILFAFVTALALMFTAPLAATAAANNSTNDNNQGYSVLAARWWTWALTQPTSSNPLLDTTGALCANQQSGSTWFLGGLWNTSGSVTRSCTIPAHTDVFFPVVNYVDCEYATDKVSVSYVRAQSAFVNQGATSLSVTLDGQTPSPKPIQFERSSVFSLNLPVDNLFDAPAGFLNPCADSGYYAVLQNLTPGSHVLQFSGTLTQPGSPPSTISARYNLTVAS